jgi:concanavalin A-like lectin/glucanase superfamily protein
MAHRTVALTVAVCVVLTAGLTGCVPNDIVALWHMDETSGSIMHDAVGDNDGKLSSVQVGEPGLFGSAYEFTGNSMATVPSSDALNAGSADLTVTIALKATETPDSNDWDLIRKGRASAGGGLWKVEYMPNGQAFCGFKGSKKSADIQAGPALDDGDWHTVQCVKTSSAIKLVVDGRTFSKSVTVGSITNGQPVIIGSHGESEFFEGLLDEANIRFD